MNDLQAIQLLTRIAGAGKTVWPRDVELASRAVIEGKRAVLLDEHSVLYVAKQALDE